MLLRYWLNLYYRLSSVIVFLICISTNVLAQNKDKTVVPGVIESLEGLIKIHKDQYRKVISKINKNPKVLSSYNDLKQVSLNQYFVKSILLYSDERYLKLVKTDECKFLSLLDSGILRTAEGEINNVVIDIEKNDGSVESAYVTKSDFLNEIYAKRCFSNKEIAILFNNANLLKTIDSVPFQVPKTGEECSNVFNDWTRNPYLPYLCNIVETISTGDRAGLLLKNTGDKNIPTLRALQQKNEVGQRLKQKISFFHRSYLKNLCFSISTPENFCSAYLKDDIWNKVVLGEFPDFYLKYKCRNVLGKSDISKAELKNCATKFNSDPAYCTGNGNEGFSSLYPLPNCNLISEALLNSHLYTQYHDCPGNLDNQAIINVHRIMAHKKKLNLLSDRDTCSAQANFSFAKLNIDNNNPEGWPLKICFFDKATDKDECQHYIPGYIPDSELDEGTVIAKILYKIRSTQPNLKCNVVDSKSYNPVRLQYRNGCFIVYDADLCTPLHCDKKVIYDKTEVTEIKYKGVPVFDYFATAFTNEKFSANNIMTESFKLEKKIIRNLTQLTNFLNLGKDTIIHGIGCAEDLLPQFFMKGTFNRCRPIPFIIDGIIERDKTSFLVLRTSIDDVHSPRLVVWNHIFSAILNYKEMHPLNTWALYGIK